jgi:hypothetical protein
MAWHRRPWLHFALIGLALFGVERAVGPRAKPVIAVSAGTIERLRADFARDAGQEPGPEDLRRLVDGAIDDEVLLREAMRRGLDGGDPAVAFRLTEKMRFVRDAEAVDESPIDAGLYREAKDLGFDSNDSIVRRILLQKTRLLLARGADEREPTELELAAFHAAHPERYARETRASLWQVFVAPAAGRDVRGDAALLLRRLREESTVPVDAVRLGDPFPGGAHFERISATGLAKPFGSEFARSVLEMKPGSWQGPVASAQGLHLVWIEAREPGALALLNSVHSRVVADWRAEGRAKRLVEVTSRLREGYSVRIDDRAAGCCG